MSKGVTGSRPTIKDATSAPDAGHQSQIGRQGGETLLEVLITAVILAVGLLAIAELQVISVRGNHLGSLRGEAALLATEMAERMRLNRIALDPPSSAYAAVDSALIDCASPPTPFCADRRVVDESMAAEPCSPAELALFDHYLFACGSPPNESVNGVEQLQGGRGVIECQDVDPDDSEPCTRGSPHRIQISWRERQAHDGEWIDAAFELRFLP